MGTRALLHIKGGDLDSDTLVTVYRQFDGYPEDGMGEDLANLADKRVVNGFSMGDTMETAANGMGCLAAQVIAGLKDKIGNIYINPVDCKDCWEEYTYTLYLHDEEVYLKVYSNIVNETLFNGSIAEFRDVLIHGTLFPEEVE